MKRKWMTALFLGAALSITGAFCALAEQGAQEESILGYIDGKTYVNSWADITMTFPETATMLLGDGSARSYPLVGGEHVDEDDPELSYRISLDYLTPETEIGTYLSQFAEYQTKYGYQTDYMGPVVIGGYEYTACKTSLAYSDGTSHHSDKYMRAGENVVLELHFDYFDELKNQADSVLGSIAKVNQ